MWECVCVFEYLLGVGEPGRLLGPVSAACGLKELVLTVGMALLTRRPQVAMLMFIWGARRKVLPDEEEAKETQEEEERKKSKEVMMFDKDSEKQQEKNMEYM